MNRQIPRSASLTATPLLQPVRPEAMRQLSVISEAQKRAMRDSIILSRRLTAPRYVHKLRSELNFMKCSFERQECEDAVVRYVSGHGRCSFSTAEERPRPAVDLTHSGKRRVRMEDPSPERWRAQARAGRKT